MLLKWISDFSVAYHAKTGRYPVIYTSVAWWRRCTDEYRGFSATNPLWLINWGSTIGPLPGWSTWTFWQYANAGLAPGDQDYFNGNPAALKRSVSLSLPPELNDPPKRTFNQLRSLSILMNRWKGNEILYTCSVLANMNLAGTPFCREGEVTLIRCDHLWAGKRGNADRLQRTRWTSQSSTPHAVRTLCISSLHSTDVILNL